MWSKIEDQPVYVILAFAVQLFLLYALFVVFEHWRWEANGQSTQGLVVEFEQFSDGERAAIIQYYDREGRRYYHRTPRSDKDQFKLEEKVELLYVSGETNDVLIKKLPDDRFTPPWFFLIAYVGIFAVAIFISTMKKIKKNRLHKHGTKVQALIVGTDSHPQHNDSVRLRCQWTHPVSQQTYIFFSPWISSQSQPQRPECQIGQTIEMLINLDKIEDYHIELKHWAEGEAEEWSG